MMEFFGKFSDQLKGWFQNQQRSSTSSTTSSSSSSSIATTTNNYNNNNNDKLVNFLKNTNSTTTTTTETTIIRSLNSNNTPIRSSSKSMNSNNNNSPSSMTIKSSHHINQPQHQQQQQVLPPSSLSLSSSSSHWQTSKSLGTPGGGTTTTFNNNSSINNNNNNNSTTSPNNTSNNYHHHSPYNHNNTTSHNHYYNHFSQNNRSFEHGYQMQHHNNNASTTSSSSSTNSFGGQIPLTPGPNISLGQRSYSAINTPDSPVNFRRQYSLNVNQRGGGYHNYHQNHHHHHNHLNQNNNSSGNNSTSRLQLDLRSQKNSPVYQQQSASTDLIDKHSLSPRPRPKDLSLSNSQDNMLKQMDGHNNHISSRAGDFFSGIGGNNRIPKPLKLTTTSSSVQNRSRPFDSLFDNTNNINNNNFFNSPHKQNYHHNGGNISSTNVNVTSNGGRSGSSRPSTGVSTPHNVYYPNRFESPRNSFLLTINKTKFENVKESDFKQLCQLGAGSFAQVYKMHHLQSNIDLAVKKMRLSANPDEIRHVQRDRDLLQRSNHKHVVQCYGYLILETEIWIFMELMATCFDRLIKHLLKRNETVPERIIGKVAVATIDALDYLKKELHVIHRDIKPSNILINNQGIIKLCDFGISGYLIDSKAHTRNVGCSPYMAPERIDPPSDGTYDVRSDIWSMGITLIEIATGQFPYKNWSTVFEILSIVIQQDSPQLPDDKNFSEEFKSFIKACLTKDSKMRPKYQELMNYPFYQKYSKQYVDVAEWFKNAYQDANNTTTTTTTTNNDANHASSKDDDHQHKQQSSNNNNNNPFSSSASSDSNSTIK